ncbi:hypothetical protein KsCSTR_42610 [Candidatus Kuenenia stuttgartiensis]|uniref:Uncharacterized protein n=1 Tax=Kuenenia stuttgartiensis TaxID=174633 RepID=A0A6G7GVK3_KUEST|nr:hypothetical protein KsCSTR_42610 [Candidatus Kuenenia stuttgartiensis]
MLLLPETENIVKVLVLPLLSRYQKITILNILSIVNFIKHHYIQMVHSLCFIKLTHSNHSARVARTNTGCLSHRPYKTPIL